MKTDFITGFLWFLFLGSCSMHWLQITKIYIYIYKLCSEKVALTRCMVLDFSFFLIAGFRVV